MITGMGGYIMTTKIAISLPEELLQAVEEERRLTGESRSQVFRHAVELLLKQRREQILSKTYRRAYEMMPEAKEDVEAARRGAISTLSGEPWS
jgi:metal-responsive CopG/Arc/MetJ family transcriptional regulator